ncbi:DMT family transporter [Fodinicurvata halophila]|uniref:DMT family transporter n=1 Tax=Fodinicurvata halophila TaxID=1419723 RepID=A0ABV8UIJ1_9PROT
MTADPKHTTRANDPGRGMALMAGAMLLVPGIDAIAKSLTPDLSPFQVAFLRFFIQSLLLAGILLLLTRGMAFRVALRALPGLAIAGVLMGAAVGLLFAALVHMPLANAIAIFFVQPLILTVFSALFLGEQVGIRRYSAVAVGLAGALIVIRPNWMAFGIVAVFPLLSAVSYAAMWTVIRSMSARTGGLQLQFYSGAFAALFLGLVLLVGAESGLGGALAGWGALDLSLWLPLLGLGGISVVGHMMIVGAFRRTEASILAPFQYLEIISATVLGFLIFDDFPDALTWTGTAIILASGLYVFYREQQRGRVVAAQSKAR